ncbi:hypothetical protein BP5796_04681 [Coleophoma crateriformis]|uniref:Uncharacterized protein n=1 Tax=Coleophoma crateriformis TaxID=565419 RepID=A0A3D8SA93_9HELO|nr:hypothetical protein BP5796_04681 [Coleophoma crateriformis]
MQDDTSLVNDNKPASLIDTIDVSAHPERYSPRYPDQDRPNTTSREVPPKTKETIPIKLIDTAVTRSDAAGFLRDTGISLKSGQLLDRSPQNRARPARYLQPNPGNRKGRRHLMTADAVARDQCRKVVNEGFDEDPGLATSVSIYQSMWTVT